MKRRITIPMRKRIVESISGISILWLKGQNDLHRARPIKSSAVPCVDLAKHGLLASLNSSE